MEHLVVTGFVDGKRARGRQPGEISHLPQQIFEQTTNGTVTISKGQSCLVYVVLFNLFVLIYINLLLLHINIIYIYIYIYIYI